MLNVFQIFPLVLRIAQLYTRIYQLQVTDREFSVIKVLCVMNTGLHIIISPNGSRFRCLWNWKPKSCRVEKPVPHRLESGLWRSANFRTSAVPTGYSVRNFQQGVLTNKSIVEFAKIWSNWSWICWFSWFVLPRPPAVKFCWRTKRLVLHKLGLLTKQRYLYKTSHSQ